jgi:hypothetical protein
MLLGGSECWFWLIVLRITESGSESGILLTQVSHGPRLRIGLPLRLARAASRCASSAAASSAAEDETIPCLKIVQDRRATQVKTKH